MSIPRKRGKVKKKLSAAKKVVRKKAKKARTRPKKKASAKPKPRKKAKRPLSVNTKPQRPRKQPERKKPTKKKKSTIRRTPPKKSVSSRPKPGKKRPGKKRPGKKRPIGLTTEQALKRPEIIEEIFLRSPAVTQQIQDRIVEKGLAELTRGMVRTKESVILGALIIAEQLGTFEQRASELAIEYNMTLREIYELWLSPPTKDL